MIRRIFTITANKVEENLESKFFRLFERNKDARFLDLGCYDGVLTRDMAKHIGTAQIYGVEIVDELIKKSEKNGVKIKSFDLNNPFDYADNYFDVVFSNQVIEHLYDVDNFICEIRRILKPGGYAIIGTVNIASWHNVACLILGWQPFDYVNIIKKKWRVGNPFQLHVSDVNTFNTNLHLKPFTIKALNDIFNLYGFQIEKIVTSGYYPLPYPFFKCLENIDKAHAAFIGFKIIKK